MTLIAENLPEELQSEIFNEKYLKLFFRAIFNMTMHWEKSMGEKMLTRKLLSKGHRMLDVCNLALSEIGQRRNAALLTFDTWDTIKQLPHSTHDAIYGTNAIQAIQIHGYLRNRKTDEMFDDWEEKELH